MIARTFIYILLQDVIKRRRFGHFDHAIQQADTVQCRYNEENFSPIKSQQIPHSSPVRAIYGVSVVTFNSYWCFAAVGAVLCVKSR